MKENNKTLSRDAVELLSNVSALTVVEEKLNYPVFHDCINNYCNKAFLEQEMEQLDLKQQGLLSFASGNKLNLIKGTLPNEHGDALFNRIAKHLKGSSIKEDIFNDEFLIFLPGIEEEEVQTKYISLEKQCLELYEESITVQDLVGVFKIADNSIIKKKVLKSNTTRSWILKTLMNVLGSKNNELTKHALRSNEMAIAIGEEIGLSKSELDTLSVLVILHDIGKLSIPEEILMKPGLLTKKEWELMKQHPEHGYRIATATEDFSHIAKFVLHHHERWDGNGYPDRLKGEKIPLLSRITSIVDAYDAMTNARPYNLEPKSAQEAILELKECAGSQFDLELVEVFVNILESAMV